MIDFTLTNPLFPGRRDSHDHYPTPRWCTEALFKQVIVPVQRWTENRSVLDPAAGEGAILNVAKEHGFETFGLELDPTRAKAASERGHRMNQGDALAAAWPRADLVVMNPPYSLAEEFVRKAIEHQRSYWPWRGTYALLRLSFLEPTRSRRDLLKNYKPDVLVLPQRPAFDGRGTDSITSAWFCWPGKGQLVWL